MEARSQGGIRTRELLRPNQNKPKTIINNERVVHGTGPPKNRNNAVEINMTGVGGEDTSYCGSFASCLIFTFSVFFLFYFAIIQSRFRLVKEQQYLPKYLTCKE